MNLCLMPDKWSNEMLNDQPRKQKWNDHPLFCVKQSNLIV